MGDEFVLWLLFILDVKAELLTIKTCINLIKNDIRGDLKMFELVSKFKPSGDQPQAIEKLVKGLEKGEKHQVLLGATGTGKTFTIANVI